MNAIAIQSALRLRHSKDLYVSECKNGPTQSIGARPIRLDGWAFLKTWSPVTSIGYEVKVSRGDFLGDHKWRDYLPLCHQLYFVAPKGLIQLAELPAEVGLIEAIGGKNGGALRLVTRRKAVYRHPETDAYLSLLHYVLMCRVRIGGEWAARYETHVDADAARRERAAQWKDWVEAEHDAHEVGFRVTSKVRDALSAMERREREALAKAAFYEATRDVLRRLGFDPDRPMSEWGLDKRIARAVGVVTPELIEAIQRAKNSLATAETELERIRTMGEAQKQSA